LLCDFIYKRRIRETNTATFAAALLTVKSSRGDIFSAMMIFLFLFLFSALFSPERLFLKFCAKKTSLTTENPAKKTHRSGERDLKM